MMRIAIASIGRFHMFDLACQLLQSKKEVRLYTGYPDWKIDQELRGHTKTHCFWVLLEQLCYRLGLQNRKLTTWVIDRSLQNFGQWLSKQMVSWKPDILDALAGTGLEAGQVMHAQGKPWICNRGSTHILVQKKILEEEYQAWHQPRPYFSQEGLKRALKEYDSADAIVVPSEFVRRSFLEQGFPKERVFKAPYGANLSLFSPRQTSETRRRPFRAFFVGACARRKGIGYLFDALKPCTQSKKIELWLIGAKDKSVSDIFHQHAGEFTHHGILPRRELADYFSRCDVLILPSVEEGLALVQAQAMACALPVIATVNTGAEDLFTDGVEGFIVPPRDSGAIREKVEWMLDNPNKTKQMGQAALQRVKQMGGWNDYGKCCLEIYRQLVSQNV